MKNKKKRIGMCLAMAFAMTISVITPSKNADAAQKKPYNGKEYGSYIRICTHEDDWGNNATYVYASKAKIKEIQKNDSGQVENMEGAVYNKKTNTLTLTNFNQPTYEIETVSMGSSFKIKLVGKNSVQTIRANINWTDKGKGYTNSITFTGNGSLTVNKNKKSWYGHGIILQAEYTKSKLTFSKTCTVTAYRNKAAMQDENGKVTYTGDKGDAISLVLSTLKKNALTSKGKLSKKVKVQKVNAESGMGYNYVIKGNSAYSKKK